METSHFFPQLTCAGVLPMLSSTFKICLDSNGSREFRLVEKLSDLINRATSIIKIDFSKSNLSKCTKSRTVVLRPAPAFSKWSTILRFHKLIICKEE
jgi:hypothetical protein